MSSQATSRQRGSRVRLARPLLLFALALAVIASMSIWLLGFGRPEPASAEGAAMSLRVYADKAKSEPVCDIVAVGRKCTLQAGMPFSIDIVASTPPVGGYDAYQVVLQFPPNITLQQQPGFAEHLFGNCNIGSETKEPGLYILSCKLDDVTTFSGNLVNVQFVCDPLGGSGQIDLVGGVGAGVSLYVSPNIQGSFVYLKSEPKGGKQVADSVQINCNEPTATPTPTSTATATSTHTATATTTQTSTPTSTPKPTVPPGKAKMSFRVYADKGKNQLVCAKGPFHRKCDVLGGVGFSIDVVADAPPTAGYVAYQIALQFSPSITLQQQPGLSEHLVGDCILGSETKGPGSYTLKCGLDDRTMFSGALANIQFNCSGGSGQIDLIGGAGAGVSVYVDPNIQGSLVFLKSADKGGKLVADSVSITCLDDSDGDGCTNVQELGPEPALGGQRDPKNPWDYFDVNGDRNIDVPNDILPVILAYLQGPLDPGGPGPNYTAAKDRGPAKAGAQNAWNRTGPDGRIDVPNDLLPIILQYLHSCKP